MAVLWAGKGSYWGCNHNQGVTGSKGGYWGSKHNHLDPGPEPNDIVTA